MESVLIIEDDATMLRGLSDNFEKNGYRVIAARDGETGLDLALSKSPDLILLDLMLPKINGYEICRHIREQGVEAPVIMLTAKDEESDVVLGLKLGADDYVTKPFSIRELLARSDALLRRKRARSRKQYTFGNCTLDIAAHRLTRDGAEIELSPREFDLLNFLLENSGRALSRDTIMNGVWGYGSAVTPRSIDRFVTTLRNKIEPHPKNPTFIHTVREFGYKFSADSKTPE